MERCVVKYGYGGKIWLIVWLLEVDCRFCRYWMGRLDYIIKIIWSLLLCGVVFIFIYLGKIFDIV